MLSHHQFLGSRASLQKKIWTGSWPIAGPWWIARHQWLASAAGEGAQVTAVHSLHAPNEEMKNRPLAGSPPGVDINILLMSKTNSVSSPALPGESSAAKHSHSSPFFAPLWGPLCYSSRLPICLHSCLLMAYFTCSFSSLSVSTLSPLFPKWHSEEHEGMALNVQPQIPN